MERATYDRMAEIDADHWWFVARRRIVAAAIARLGLSARARILEVGCGTGSNLAMLQRFGRVDALEPDAGARALASRRGGFAVTGGLLPDAAAAFEDGAYDLIVMLDVLEHIPDDRAALASLLPKLAPGGRLLLTVPANPWMWSAHDAAHHHQRRYTPRTLRAVLADGRFAARRLTHFNSLLFPLIAAARALGKLTGKEGGDDAMPPAPVNRLLGAVFAAERHIAVRGSLPFGVSLLAVAEPAIR